MNTSVPGRSWFVAVAPSCGEDARNTNHTPATVAVSMAVALFQARPHAAPLLYVRDEWRDPATLLALQQGLTQAQCMHSCPAAPGWRWLDATQHTWCAAAGA